MIQAQIDTLNERVAALGEILQEQRSDVAKQSESRQELQREQFRQRKHSVTIGHMTEDLEVNQHALEAYEAERTQLREGLQTILDRTKGLRGALDE